jgi:hypothetical protein
MNAKTAARVVAVAAIAVAGAAMVLPGYDAPATAGQSGSRQLAVATLPGVKVVTTAVRGPGSGEAAVATVWAAGYRHTAQGWQLIRRVRIPPGGGRQWSWQSVAACSVTVTPQAAPKTATLRISLRGSPATACSAVTTISW